MAPYVMFCWAIDLDTLSFATWLSSFYIALRMALSYFISQILCIFAGTVNTLQYPFWWLFAEKEGVVDNNAQDLEYEAADPPDSNHMYML